MIAYVFLAIYSLALLYITVYCLMQLKLLVAYKRYNKKAHKQSAKVMPKPVSALRLIPAGMDDDQYDTKAWPLVTIQLPIYNEKYVIDRLIDSVARFDYPRDRFEIHILDDSTDETVDLVADKVAQYQAEGFRIEQVRRPVRQGFKAGALRDGMPLANGEFIVIFDADFVPRPDFLRRTLPYFEDEKVGVVQTRWEHINGDYSLITRLQALQLNVHFTVEQVGRMGGEHFLQFNGTAGIWRRDCIEEAGGWEADTLTEDLDLSIRAQLKGWRIHFLEHVGSPAELPAEMNSLKSQQHRWMKGGAETARKLLPEVWRSKIGLGKKIHATVHLLASTVFVFVFIMGVFSVPLLFWLNDLMAAGFDKDWFAGFLVGLLSIMAVYYVANVQAPVHRDRPLKAIFKFVVLFPLFLALSMGLSLHNTVAVIQGYRGKRTPFVRTPKFNIQSLRDSFSRKAYLVRKLSWTTIMEGVLALYFAGAVAYALYQGNLTFLYFHGMLALGYGAIFYYTLRHLSLK